MVMSTYRCRRPIRIGESQRQPGELVPEAFTWHIVDSQVHAGNLQPVVVDEQEFIDAVEKYCPELAEQLGVPLKVTKPAGVVAIKKEK